MQRVTSNNSGRSCLPTMLRLFARGLMLQSFLHLNDCFLSFTITADRSSALVFEGIDHGKHLMIAYFDNAVELSMLLYCF